MRTTEQTKLGAEAIVYLQSLAGIKWTLERGEAAWRGMKDWEKESTLRTYELLKPKKGES